MAERKILVHLVVAGCHLRAVPEPNEDHPDPVASPKRVGLTLSVLYEAEGVGERQLCARAFPDDVV